MSHALLYITRSGRNQQYTSLEDEYLLVAATTPKLHTKALARLKRGFIELTTFSS